MDWSRVWKVAEGPGGALEPGGAPTAAEGCACSSAGGVAGRGTGASVMRPLLSLSPRQAAHSDPEEGGCVSEVRGQLPGL